jgi:hypothetical protein
LGTNTAVSNMVGYQLNHCICRVRYGEVDALLMGHQNHCWTTCWLRAGAWSHTGEITHLADFSRATVEDVEVRVPAVRRSPIVASGNRGSTVDLP